MAMQPEQVIATILTYYYEAWKAGFEKGRRTSPSESVTEEELTTEATETNIEQLATEFIRHLKPSKAFSFIVREFASWIKRNNIDPSKMSENIIEAFLDAYREDHNISKKTYYTYKTTLRSFMRYIRKQY